MFDSLIARSIELMPKSFSEYSPNARFSCAAETYDNRSLEVATGQSLVNRFSKIVSQSNPCDFEATMSFEFRQLAHGFRHGALQAVCYSGTDHLIAA